MNELKPCPFCGGEAIFKQTRCGTRDEGALLNFHIECKECEARAPGASGYLLLNLHTDGTIHRYHDDIGKARNAWNRRAE